MKLIFCVSVICVFQYAAGMGMVGGWSNVDKTSLNKLTLGMSKSITQNLNQSPPELIRDRNGYYTLKNIHCALSQVVAGMKYSVHYVASVGDNDNSDIYCIATVFMQVWNNITEVSQVTCKSNKTDEWSYCIGNAYKHKKLKKEPLDDAVNPFLFMGAPIMNKLPTVDLDDPVKPMFNMFLKKYEKEYSEFKDVEQYKQRFDIFKTNLKEVEKLNNISLRIETNSAVYGITKFMDMSREEFKNYMGFKPSLKEYGLRLADVSDLDVNAIPDSVDWRKLGAVTAVKNQGQCGSCWAFSTTGNVEGQWFLKHKQLISLSEQELVDCDTVDQGCSGGLPSNAYKSIEKLGGLEGEKDYPYIAEGEKCKFKSGAVKVSISDAVSLPQDETQLASWLAKNGPISIGINANMMQFYWGGIAHPWKLFCNPKSLDHGVLIVGFGTENGTPYWIIKNSWGPDWGEKGYYRIYRGDGSCGLNMMATSSVAA